MWEEGSVLHLPWGGRLRPGLDYSRGTEETVQTPETLKRQEAHDLVDKWSKGRSRWKSHRWSTDPLLVPGCRAKCLFGISSWLSHKHLIPEPHFRSPTPPSQLVFVPIHPFPGMSPSSLQLLRPEVWCHPWIFPVPYAASIIYQLSLLFCFIS
jgi:hypothetical protein